MISLQFILTKQDYINFYTFAMWDAPEKKRSKLYYYGKQLLINGGILTFILFSGSFRLSTNSFYLFIGLLLMIVVLQLISGRDMIRKQAAKIADDPANGSIFSTISMEISDLGIYVKDEFTETNYYWKAFIRKEENELYYYLFNNGIQAIIIPKRVLKTAAEKQQFEKLLQMHLSFDAEVGHLLKS